MSAMTLIEHIEVGAGGAADIEFSAIPSTFTDLYLLYSLRSNRAANLDVLFINFNNVSSGYSRRMLRGTGSGVASDTGDTAQFNVYGLNGGTSTSNTFSSGSLYLPNYTSTNNKSVSIDDVFENNATEAWQGINGGLWSNSSTVATITLTKLFGTTFVEGSSATLYGITAGSDGTTTVS